MPTHKIMTADDGDQRFDFKVDDKRGVAKAMQRFNDLVKGQKMWAAKTDDQGRTVSLMREFEPDANVVFMRQVQGG